MRTKHERQMSKVEAVRTLLAASTPSPDGVQVKRTIRVSPRGCVVVRQRVILSTTPSREMAVND